MPNYGLVVGSKFQPFSYQELVAPVMEATKAHQALEDAYGQLSIQADEWKKVATQEPDSKAAQAYLTFANSLQQQATQLAESGLTPQSRRDMWNMARRYSSEIAPIASAYNTKMKEVEDQAKSGDKNIYEYDARTKSVDDYMNNEFMRSKSLDRMNLLKESAAIYGQLADRIHQFELTGNLDEFRDILTKDYGLTPAEATLYATQIRRGNFNIVNNPIVGSIAQSIFERTGVGNWNSREAERQTLATIAEGMYSGIGKREQDYIENAEAKYLTSTSKKGKGDGEDDDDDASPYFTRQNFRASDFDKNSANYYDFKWSDNKLHTDESGEYYIIPYGKVNDPTSGATQSVQRGGSSGSFTDGYYPSVDVSNLKFNEDVYNNKISFLESLGLHPRKMKTKDGYTTIGITKDDMQKLKDYSVNENSFDVYRESYYERYLDTDQFPDVLSRLINKSGDKGIEDYEIAFDKDKKFHLKPRDKKVKFDDDSKITSASVIIDHNNNAFIKYNLKDDKKAHYLPLSDLDPDVQYIQEGFGSNVKAMNEKLKEILSEIKQYYDEYDDETLGSMIDNPYSDLNELVRKKDILINKINKNVNNHFDSITKVFKTTKTKPYEIK